jgi:CspA family cold shock protein
MATGTVKWFNNAKGYGFICPTDNQEEDIFAHFSAIVMEGYKSLKAGQLVSFEIQKGPKGLHAMSIQALSDGEENVSQEYNNAPLAVE